ncbi:GntR family transcriptional repressor for pyruvate dehydrogenase complex [Mobilisporobacter senegalensis]|uniref:GntR family transcriptional repressor for pyruvate dehydrogenase complex n=1 Tax=Mobilisporobacter senegalensis TaxID=1329262 RepID=A0A3N1XKR4_9FIRM|nr:FadR/GntR family transcriptional regulator [Mobilisporobacter senegalensis]ROR27303.1 GntR family transcriptional repressor for pyruvate dehydrogenase complex [Mobilisporobacter senegalensis]
MGENSIGQKSYIKVIDYIKKQIRIGELRIGSKLPAERELSEILGVSRNSVREAIRTLDIMGVISSQQGAGNYLSGNFENNMVETMSMMFLLDQIDYRQISQLRRGLELQALIIAIDNITEPEIIQLEKIILQLEHESEENNVILDKRLHYNIALASKNTLIINILQALSEIIDQFIVDLRREILSTADSKSRLMEAHIDMVKSLVNKDKKLAYEAINKHFGTIDEKILKNDIKTSI